MNQDFNPVVAIEENTAEFLLALGAAAQSPERREPYIHWTIGNSPIDYHNAVVRAKLSGELADREIRASVEALRACGVPGIWHVGPSMEPIDLGDRLIGHGFRYGGDDIGMSMDLQALPALQAPADTVIQRVRDEDELTQWIDVLSQGFGEGPAEAQWVGDMYRRIGYEDSTPWRHYVASQAGVPVAAASMFFGAGAAGIYFVMTAPQARRRGLGTAITVAALAEAKELGYEYGVLCASAMGYGVYQKIGFQEYCRIGLYEWRPEFEA